ncbi:hypothetical protein HYC85_026157 [Camellia sinensis]|uniref:EF-hand domain-containing protein n=1 Tax=Camellia sinensis TaxID=4442 RepID=A0A7J7G612_CAMSI|nr:hypothetical protein HYC85_026157 [Camellia sinensis]
MEIHSSPKCSKDQQSIYQQWFNYVDKDGDGRITGNDATKFFAMSNFPRQDLKQLVSLAQGGHAPTNDILNGEVGKPKASCHGRFGCNTSCKYTNVFVKLFYGSPNLLIDNIQTKKKCASKTSDPELNGKIFFLFTYRNAIFLLSALINNDAGSLPQSSSANWFTSTKSAKKVPISSVTSIVDGLKKLYIQKLKPLEVTYQFNDFESPLLVRAHIEPEPTTDRFVVMNGPDERSIPGNTIAVQADLPFSSLTTFGTSFLSKFECPQMPHPLLEHITFVDTPGVLAGEKQQTQRSYDFTGVTSWFAAKFDLILLLFDPHQLDISDEFKRVISSLRGHDDKICVVLNKSDQVDTQQVRIVYCDII